MLPLCCVGNQLINISLHKIIVFACNLNVFMIYVYLGRWSFIGLRLKCFEGDGNAREKKTKLESNTTNTSIESFLYFSLLPRHWPNIGSAAARLSLTVLHACSMPADTRRRPSHDDNSDNKTRVNTPPPTLIKRRGVSLRSVIYRCARASSGHPPLLKTINNPTNRVHVIQN